MVIGIPGSMGGSARAPQELYNGVVKTRTNYLAAATSVTSRSKSS